eukprot:COSAG01_NODE_26846_length_701_cov_2.387043_2_plen_69_part_01
MQWLAGHGAYGGQESIERKQPAALNLRSHSLTHSTSSDKSMVHSRLGHSLRKVERAGLWILYSNMSQAL